MPLQPLDFKPGINKDSTSYTAEGGWFDGNLVRFRKGFAEKIGGWQKYILPSYEGTGRKLHNWVNLAGTKLLGLGTRYKLYLQDGSVYNDITPIRSTTAAGDVTFAAVDGSSTLTVSDTAHDAAQNDFVTFSGAVSLGGNITADVLNQEYQIVAISTANAYTVIAKDTDGDEVTANSSDSGNGGGSIVGTYQLTVGLDVFVGEVGSGCIEGFQSMMLGNFHRLLGKEYLSHSRRFLSPQPPHHLGQGFFESNGQVPFPQHQVFHGLTMIKIFQHQY